MTLFWLSISTFGVCVASGFVPLINAEIYLLAASAATPRHASLYLILMGTLGQMTAKVVMYYAGRGTIRLPAHRYSQAISRAAVHMERWRGRRDLMIFVSAFSGLPPFFAISVLAGAVSAPLWRFVVAGFLGRLLRFTTVVLFPDLLKSLLP
ncbi:MAG: VTT domain-containing protein [Gemmatimonadetes bacterium]|nr:VTT domain-containing protein [Gemmatimonadota bacterium]